jgi:hypothetical protein
MSEVSKGIKSPLVGLGYFKSFKLRNCRQSQVDVNVKPRQSERIERRTASAEATGARVSDVNIFRSGGHFPERNSQRRREMKCSN